MNIITNIYIYTYTQHMYTPQPKAAPDDPCSRLASALLGDQGSTVRIGDSYKYIDGNVSTYVCGNLST